MTPLTINTTDCHVAGAPLRLIVDGFPAPDGRSLAERQGILGRRHDHLRRGLLGEPRGHADLTAAVLTPPVSSGGHLGLLFMDAHGYPAFSGHGLIGAITIALERSLFVTRDSSLPLVVDTVSGPVEVRPGVTSGNGPVRVAQVAYRSHPSFIVAAGIRTGEGAHDGTADIVWADGLYALTDGESLGMPLTPGHLPLLRRAALAMLDRTDVRRFGSSIPAGGPARLDGLVLLGHAASGADIRSVTVHRSGLVDRSPSGRATAAVVTVLDAMGLVDDDRTVVHESLWGTRFTARVAARHAEAERHALTIEVVGDAWITGDHQFVFHPDDPLREGFDLSP